MEEEEGKVRHISQQEAREIDATKVAYFTLNDGTVLLVKNDDNPEPQEILQENIQMNSNEEEEKNMAEENQQLPEEQELQQNIISGQENQEQYQIQSQNENQQIVTGSENEQINYIQTQSQNAQEVQQQISNLGYNIPSDYDNVYPNSEHKYCTCNSNCNAKLIKAQNIGTTYIQRQTGNRRQLYKLVEAIPVRFCDVQGVQLVNQTNNMRFNLQQYNSNTYIVERSNINNFSNYQINTQNSGNEYQQINIKKYQQQIADKPIINQQIIPKKEQELKCNCKLTVEQPQEMENNLEGENQQEEENQQVEENQQLEEIQQEEEIKCCCPIGNPKLREEIEIISPEIYEKYKK